MARLPRRTRRLGRADLVRRSGHAGRAARVGGAVEGLRRRVGKPRRRLALVGGTDGAARRLLVLALRLREHVGARDRDVPGVFRGRCRAWRTAAPRGPDAWLLLEYQRRD